MFKLDEDWDTLTAAQKVQRILDEAEETDKRFSAPLFTDKSNPLTLVSASTTSPTTARATFAYTIPHYFTNRSGNLHGGAAATIFDICTTLAFYPICRPGFWSLGGGVSRTLSVSYLRPAAEGEKVLIECEVVSAGRRMGATRAVMRREKDGVVLSLCEHDKANTDKEVKGKL